MEAAAEAIVTAERPLETSDEASAYPSYVGPLVAQPLPLYDAMCSVADSV